MAPIIYGYPTPDLINLSKLDQVVLGGTTIKEYTHYCHKCQETYPFIEVEYEA
jgi:hypothetical protein